MTGLSKRDPLGPSPRPWTADNEEFSNQYGDCDGRPIILDADGKLVATFQRTIDRDLFMKASHEISPTWNTRR